MKLLVACASIAFVALLPACNRAPQGVIDDTADTQAVELRPPAVDHPVRVLYGAPRATICNFRQANASELLEHKGQRKDYGGGYSSIILTTEGSGRHTLLFKPAWVKSRKDASLIFCSGTSTVGSGRCSLLGISAEGCFEVTILNPYTLAQTERLLSVVRQSYPLW